MPDATQCPECGAVIPDGQPRGLCPRCGLKGALDLGTAADALTPSPSHAMGDGARKAGEGRAGKQFGDYELLEEIARGGMGVVYKARQKSLDRFVAVKVLLFGTHASAEFIKRFRIEASAAAALQHPNIVSIHEVGVHEGEHFLVMDYVDGPNLAQFAKDQPPTAKRAAQYLKTVAEAIHYAHEKGILHRDLKPSNVLIDSNDQPRVTDFGLAKRLRTDSQPSTDLSQLTLSGHVLGSPGYMPPEQAAGARGKMGRRSDVYSLGAMLYHLLTGRPPFQGENVADTLNQVLNIEPVSPRLLQPRLPVDLETICLKCLEKEPAKRYHTAHELADELGRFLNGESVHARPVSRPEKLWRWCGRKPTLAAAAAVALLLFLVIAVGSPIMTLRVARQRERAEDQTRRAQSVVTRLEIERAENFFTANNSAAALARLARTLRRETTNRVAAERIVNALRQRSICIPTAPVLEHGEAPAEFVEMARAATVRPDMGHDSLITSAEFSPDSLRVMTASMDGTVRLWDANSGAAVLPPIRLNGPVMEAHLSADGKRVVAGGLDRTARVWDAASGEPVTPILSHEGGVLCAGFSPDGRQVVTGSQDRKARLWDAGTGEMLQLLDHAGEVYQARFSPDGRRLATLAKDETVTLWDVATGKQISSSKEGHIALFLTFSPDGTGLLSGGLNWTVVLRDGVTGEKLWIRDDHHKNVRAGLFSPDGQWMITGGDDALMRLGHARSNITFGLDFKHSGAVLWAEYSTDGRRIATASRDKTACVWDAASGRRLVEPLHHDSPVALVRFSPDGRRLLTAAAGHKVWLWSLRVTPPWSEEFFHGTGLNYAHFNPDGSRLALGGEDGAALVWEPQARDRQPGFFPQNGYILRIEFSPDGKKMFTIGRNANGEMWDVEARKKLYTLKHKRRINTAQFTPAGTQLLTASDDGTAQLWNVGSTQALLVLTHQAEVNSASLSPDGSRAVTASRDKSAQVWNLQEGSRSGPPLLHGDVVHSARFSRDGTLVVTASKDKTALIWDAATGRRVTPALQHDDAVTYAEFSADGRHVVTLSGNAARLWNARTGQPESEPLVHDDRVHSVQFSPDGLLLVTASQNATARVWDAATGHPVTEKFTHDDPVLHAEFSPDGRWVATASMDKLARVWEIFHSDSTPPSWLAELAEAVAGQRFDENDQMRPVPPSALTSLRHRIEKDRGTNRYATWARWFLDTGPARTRSSESRLTMEDLRRQLLRANSHDSLEYAIQWFPHDPLVATRWARHVIEAPTGHTRSQVNQAHWDARRLPLVAPGEAEAWRLRAISLVQEGEYNQALRWLDTALSALPASEALWVEKASLLQMSNRLAEAFTVVTNGLATVRRTGGFTTNSWELYCRRVWLEAKLKMRIEPRDPATPSTCLDLGRFYNASLTEDWLNNRIAGYNLAQLPMGRQRLAEVDFDVRGIVQLTGQRLVAPSTDYPRIVTGIPVGQKCRRLHFLQGAGWIHTNQAIVGRYIIRYEDGTSVVKLILYGHDVRDVWSNPGDDQETPGSTVAWTGSCAAMRSPGPFLRLYRSAWENPRPEVPVKSIDFESRLTQVAPFLIAITAEK